MDNFHPVKGLKRKDAVGMDELVKRYVRECKLSAGLNTQRVFAAWDAVSGASALTTRRFYRDGVLYVTMSSSMVRSQLEFQKTSLIRSINVFLEKDELFVKDYSQVGYVKSLIIK